MPVDLPSEVLTQIFTLASDEDLVFQYAHPTSLANASWFKHAVGDWALRPPQEAVNLLMRRSYGTKKAILLTCKWWHEVGYELMFRCLFFNAPSKLLDLCKILESSSASATTVTSSVGWWARRLHVCRYSTREFEERGITNEDMQKAFVLIISHCPNLEIFHVDWPMKEAFGPVADALRTFSKRSLRTISWNVSVHDLSKVIWALDSLKNIVVAHIEFEGSTSTGESEEEGCVNLGSAFDFQLQLKHLYQLSVRGYTQAFLEQAVGWLMPSLKVLSIDSGITKSDPPDVIGFLEQHGDNLEFLDLDTSFSLDVARILDHCQQLTTFAFNADWRITPNDDVESQIVHRSMPTITTIGLHGLHHAFGVGLAAATANLANSRMIQRYNDMNMTALNKRNFPNLRRIRALSRGLLVDLNKAGQPSQDMGGMERWERWWDRCTAAGIHLEDCTGDSFGNLPDDDDESSWSYNDSDESSEASNDSDEDYDDEDEDDEDEEEEEGGSDEESDDSDDSDTDGSVSWTYEVPPLPAADNPMTAELRQLLEECRLMAQEREEPSPLFSMMGMGSMQGSSSEALAAFQRHYGTAIQD